LSKKVLIMPSPEERERAADTTSGPNRGDALFAPSDIRSMAAIIDIYRNLAGIVVLEATTKSHTEKIEQLTQWVSAIPSIEKDVAQNTKDLNELGKRHDKDLNELGRRLEKDVNELGRRHDKDIKELEKVAHTADTLIRIVLGILAAIAGPALFYLYHHVSLVFSK
jgi:hypothetical protein